MNFRLRTSNFKPQTLTFKPFTLSNIVFDAKSLNLSKIFRKGRQFEDLSSASGDPEGQNRQARRIPGLSLKIFDGINMKE